MEHDRTVRPLTLVGCLNAEKMLKNDRSSVRQKSETERGGLVAVCQQRHK